jgi:integrase
MATVFWKGKQWVAQWYRPDGSRVKRGTGCDKRREAEREAAEMEGKDRKAKGDGGRKFEEILSRVSADAKAGKLSFGRAAEFLTELRTVTDPDFKAVSVADHLAGWVAEKSARVKPKTTEAHKHMLRRFKGALGAEAMKSPLSDLTRAQVDKALRKIKDGGLRGATVNLDLRIFRQAMKQAVEDGLLLKNPTDGIKPLPEDDSTERAPFEAAEVRKMIDHPKTSDEWRGMILFGAHTGLRLGDVAQLAREHVEGVDLVIRPKKTERSRKTIRIPLTPPLVAWIGDRTGLFFPRAAKVTAATLSTQFPRIMARAGVPADVVLPGNLPGRRSFHSLRHSFTSWLAEADIHADIRQKLTGHSSAGVHARYTHHDQSLARAIETLPDLPSARPAESA